MASELSRHVYDSTGALIGWIRLEWVPDPTPRVVRVEFGGPVLTSEVVAALAPGVDALLEEAVRESHGLRVGGFEFVEHDGPAFTRRTIDDALLGEVATVYLEASNVGVMRHFDVSRSTASRWVAVARDRGLI